MFKKRKIKNRGAKRAANRANLKILNGEIVCLDGTKPDFSELEGAKVVVCEHEGFRKLYWKSKMAGIG